MAQAIWTRQAEIDLEEIAFHIALTDNRPVTADRIVDEFLEKARTYATQPEMGTRASELGEGLRVFTHKRWVVVYQPIDRGILVRAVIDAARDYPHWRP